MCLKLATIEDGTVISCRKCWQCAERKIDDYVGRCIAESRTAKRTHYVTLTYGRDDNDNPDHVRAAVLTYSDVQKWFKTLRNNGFPCRYLVAGEFGEKKGRTHWHLIIFWSDKHPEVKLRKKRTVQGLWEKGFSYWEQTTPENMRYCCKYVQKDQQGADNRQGHFVMSKKPPLGSVYLKQLAKKYVSKGMSPQDLVYYFPEAKRKDGKRIAFHMKDRSAELFLEEYVRGWKEKKGGHYPPSELVDLFRDKQVEWSADDPLPSELNNMHIPFVTKEEKERKERERQKWPKGNGSSDLDNIQEFLDNEQREIYNEGLISALRKASLENGPPNVEGSQEH